MPPSITVAYPTLKTDGPVLDASILINSDLEKIFRDNGEEIPSPAKVRALIDTGASGTVIQEGIADSLGLKPVGETRINTPSSTNVRCNLYNVRMIFQPNNVLIDGITVAEAPLKNQPIKCLIGRDVLSLGVFIYTGYINQITLSF